MMTGQCGAAQHSALSVSKQKARVLNHVQVSSQLRAGEILVLSGQEMFC